MPKTKLRFLLTRDQFKRLANILDNLGQVILASVVFPAIFGAGFDGVSSKMLVLSGTFTTFVIWLIALRIEKVSP